LIPLNVRYAQADIREQLEKYHLMLVTLGKLSSIQCLNEGELVPISASAVVGEIELLIPMAGLIEKDAELNRLARELAKLDKEIAFADNKLNNPAFTDKAPVEIIEQMRIKRSEALSAREKCLHHQAKVESLP
jgi:valyl-tRNA synthetase